MFIALDLETTGLNSSDDKIIEIALIKVDKISFEVISKFTSYINPGIEIPQLITNITGISSEDVMLSPYIDEVKDQIIEFISDLPILGHNISFDIDFLLKAGVDVTNNITIDTFLLANFTSFNNNSLSLESLCLFYGISLKGSHRALNDIIATINLFEVLIKEISKFSKIKKEILKYIINKSNNKGLIFFIDNYLEKDILIIDSSIFLKYLLKYFPENKKQKKIIINNELNVDSSKKLLSTLNNLDIRENQQKMIDIVDSVLDNNEFSLVEAPTGLGKTFAYLTPSIIYSVKNGEQVFISTTTKALQDQICYKDLEFLKNNLYFDFTYSKLKGRSNYIGLNSFITFFSDLDNLSGVESSFLLKIVYWIFETKTYELDELEYYGDEFSFKNEINADNPIIFSKQNIYENREPASIFRKAARNSNIVVINNSLLFQDIDSDNAILGNIKNLVLDEAHNLEDVVTNALKKSFSMKDLEKTFSIILNIAKKNKHQINNYEKNTEDLIFNLQVLFDSLEFYLNYKISDNSNYKNVLIEDDFYSNNIDNFELESLGLSIKNKFNVIIDNLKILPDALYLEVNKEILYLEVILDIVDKILNKESGIEFIRTINYTNYKGLFIETTLLNVGDFLEKKLWGKLDSCLLTSATLSIDSSFDYISKLLYLKKFNFYSLESDFDYKKQALLYIPDDLGNIKNNLLLIINFLNKFLSIVKGKTLVLFTALYLIKEIYIALGLEFKKKGITIYAQAVAGGKNKLLEFYKKNANNSVLFGTDTFWEGIDIPGDDLKYLVIHKVPFMVPTDPIFKARSKLFDDSFNNYSIPKSIIKLKQGFGRLIRTKNDSGIIVFLDDRVYTTKWGETLLKAFPESITIKKGSYKLLLDVLKNK